MRQIELFLEEYFTAWESLMHRWDMWWCKKHGNYYMETDARMRYFEAERRLTLIRANRRKL